MWASRRRLRHWLCAMRSLHANSECCVPYVPVQRAGICPQRALIRNLGGCHTHQHDNSPLSRNLSVNLVTCGPDGFVNPCTCCRFFPALQYLSTSKIAIAVAGNFAFAMALCLYQVMVKVRRALCCASPDCHMKCVGHAP